MKPYMKPNFSQVCRFFLVAILFLFSQHIYAQTNSKLDFKYKIESVKVGDSLRYDVKVTILNGEGPFMVSIYENLKDDMIALDRKEGVLDSVVSLSFFGKRDCVIYVRNKFTSLFKTIKY